MKDIQTREDIALFVHAFYGKVQEDGLLAPIFNGKIQPDQWPTHLDKMTSFWSSILLQETDYKGNPFQHHTKLGIDKSHFDQWIKLFNETINENFLGPKAQMAMVRADSIRNIFQSKLEFLGQ